VSGTASAGSGYINLVSGIPRFNVPRGLPRMRWDTDAATLS
jgi:hypothetical protein